MVQFNFLKRNSLSHPRRREGKRGSSVQKDKPIQQFHLLLNSDLEELARVLAEFETRVSALMPEQLFWICQIALAEGFTNAVRHAHKDLPPTTPIDLEIKLFTSCLEIYIWDQGQFFDLQAKLAEICQEDDDWTKETGRGLRWMSELMDEFRYVRVFGPKNEAYPERNCLMMQKKW